MNIQCDRKWVQKGVYWSQFSLVQGLVKLSTNQWFEIRHSDLFLGRKSLLRSCGEDVGTLIMTHSKNWRRFQTLSYVFWGFYWLIYVISTGTAWRSVPAILSKVLWAKASRHLCNKKIHNAKSEILVNTGIRSCKKQCHSQIKLPFLKK